MNAAVIDSTVSEHIDEATFLWLERTHAVRAANYAPEQFADLDERLAAHIDGLRVAEEAGWKLCEDQMVSGEPEDLFPAAVLAIEARNDLLDQLFDHVVDAPEALPGLTSAFGWVDEQFLGGTVKALLASSVPIRQLVGVTACAMHRKDPGAVLEKFLADQSKNVRARALRACGELGRKDLMTQCIEASKDPSPKISFWAAWSAVLLGDRGPALTLLCQHALSQKPIAERAFRLCLCAMSVNDSSIFLKQLSQNPIYQRFFIIGCGLSGDPQCIPGLLQKMEAPESARLTGEAFTLITGLDISLGDFEAPGPDDFEVGPTEEPEDEDVGLDPDIGLPWPNIEKVEAWWKENQGRFTPGQQYFFGEPLSATQCQTVLHGGFQRQRVAAALHLALLQPGSVLFPTSAPARRQQQLLKAQEIVGPT